MADPGSEATIRAAVEVILPPRGGRPGGVELGVHEHVVHSLELALPGFVDLIAALLDATAMEADPGKPFVDLDHAGRTAALRALSSDEAQDVREAADALLVFSFGGMYSEWSGYDRASGELTPPAVWEEIGFHGPSLGHPEYRES